MDLKNTFTKTSMTGLALMLASLLSATTATANTQNEVSATVQDIEGFNDNFYTASYVRYLDSVKSDSGAYLINPYLQRVSSLFGGYARGGDRDALILGGTFYFNEQWSITAEGSYSELDNNYGDQESKFVKASVGYNLSPEWQIGAGLQYISFDYDLNFDGNVFDEEFSNTSPVAFTRYTTVGKTGTGWDLMFEFVEDDADTYTGSARYFFSPGLSVAGTFEYVNSPSGFDDDKRAGIEVDYWFNEQFSVTAGYEKNTDSDADDDVATLSASYRL